MANTRFIRFFDKQGNDMNLGATQMPLVSLYDGATSSYTSYTGGIFFPKVSVKLIESQQLFILQEVTGPTASFQLLKVPGSVTVTAGNPTLEGVSSDFTILEAGDTIEINGVDYSVTSVSGATSMTVSPTPSSSINLTSNIYYYDYLSYNQLRSSIGTFDEVLKARFEEEQDSFFLYDIDFQEDIPFIQKGYTSSFSMVNGSSDTIDPLTGRVLLQGVTGPDSVVTLPTEINLGISSETEDIFQKNLLLEFEKTYVQSLVSSPVGATSTITFEIGGTGHEIYTSTEFYLQGVTGASSTVPFFEKKLEVVSASQTSTTTFVAKLINLPDLSVVYSSYRILWKNTYNLATLSLYGETESEDERFKIVLQNFGKKIDQEYEYIFRESDINEELTNFEILNKKRKELLLEGDNIYPYMGSYKGLINIINFFGYYDLRIKEYFLNVDTKSSNFGKYLHVQVPKTEAQRKQLRAAWSIVPSSIYKKTSLFGLFYDLNRATDEEDIYGIPEVVDAFDFTPEEVLIKLFGLKELLKKDYLPLNARIYDITGEGIYFERIRVDSWADNLNHLVLDLGTRPTFAIYPEGVGYITDLRRIDDYYVKTLSAQGLVGFYGPSASDPYLSASGFTGSISQLFSTNVESYQYFLQQIYDENGDLRPVVDTSWEYMPPGISNPDYNVLASRLFPLPDDDGILAGSPVLLEALFEIAWEDAYFTYSQLGILGPTGAPKNINLWTWDTLGRGEYIEMRWTIEKQGFNAFFYDSGRVNINSFLVQTRGATVFGLPAQLSADVSGGSIVDIDIVNAGFGYTNVPAITIALPDTPGTGATAACTVENGYVTGLTFSVGSGYTFAPTVTIDPPDPVYEIANRILHTVSLPYEGEYQIGLYIYDITNGYTVDFKKFTVKNKNVDFAQSFRRETSERTWLDFAEPEEPTPEDRSYRTISWEETTGPWYYPLHVKSRWDDCEVSWESLNYSSYDGTGLYEYEFTGKIESIDRNNDLVVITGNQTGFLSNQITLNVGDFLFLTRESPDPVAYNLIVEPDSVQSLLYSDVAGIPTIALLDGVFGETTIYTSTYDTSPYLVSGDSIWIQGKWYKVNGVGSTAISIELPLTATFTGSQALQFVQDGEINLSLSSSATMERYSRIVITDSCDYETVDTQNDYYDLFDGLTYSGGILRIKGDEDAVKDLIVKNSALGDNSKLFASWGVFSGTYAIEITNISLTGSNTQFRLNDPNRELYYLDGNFSVKLADYDVDYAETRIGPSSLTYENADEFTWNENLDLSWYGLEYHGGVLCGYVIPFVSPGGNITIDENPTFVFSGDSTIDSTKAGLAVAAAELNASENSGISKYDYAVLPEDELYVKDSLGNNIDFFNTFSPGSNAINLTSAPDGGSLKIPIQATVTVSGGSITNVTILNSGYGYDSVPVVTLDETCAGGTGGSVTFIMSGLPYAGYATGATWNPGSGYTGVPALNVSPPAGFKEEDNWLWTGYEWVKVIEVVGNTLNLENPLNYPVFGGEFPLLPYDYHKQLYLDPETFQQFYYFIQGKAKNPGNENLSYVIFDNGVQGEWASHPFRSYTYPLLNSFLQILLYGQESISQDYLYNQWVYEGSDYPPLCVPDTYDSNVISYESRIPYGLTLQSAFSYIDTVISPRQQKVKQFTPVVFHFDNCKIPGKKNPLWTIKNEDTGELEVITDEKKFMWNFTRTGNFTVSLKIEDSNGNLSTGDKKSFVVVESD